MRRFMEILLITFLMLGSSDIRHASGDTLFHDNFDDYIMGIFPTIGGWNLLFEGSGNIGQYVDNLYSVSHNQSLRLEGSSCWRALAYHDVDFQNKSLLTLEVNVYVGPNVDCGCGPALAEFALYNPTSNTSPSTGFAGVSFNCDGYIWGGNDGDIDNGGRVRLLPYHPNTWYNIRIDYDLTKRISAVYIDGVLGAAGISLDVSGVPTGVALGGGYSINNPVWYDDVCVMDLLSPMPLPPTPTETPTLTASGLLTIPFLQWITLTGTINLWAEMQLVSQCSPPDICFRVTTFGTF